MWKNKKVVKTTKIKKNDLNIWFISTSNIKIGTSTYEANKSFNVDEKTAELLKWSIFYKKWTLKII